MQPQYTHLFTLQVLHDSFPRGKSSEISFVPTGDSAALLENLNIRMVDRGDSTVDLYQGSSNQNPGPLTDPQQPLKLSFLLRPNDPAFFNYTDLPLKENDRHACYFTNLGMDVGEIELFLTAGEVPRLPVIAPGFQFTRQGSESVFLLDEPANILDSFPPTQGNAATLGTMITPLSESKLSLNLTNLPAGRYTLEGESGVLHDFITAPNSFLPGDVGMISIYLGDTEAAGERIITENQVTKATYTIAFSARSTIWRYHLIDGSPTPTKRCWIESTSGTSDFPPPGTPVQQSQLPNGQTAQIIESTRPIRLRRVYDYGHILHFTRSENGRDTEVTLNLPAAGWDRISDRPGREEYPSGENIFYSDFFIYV